MQISINGVEEVFEVLENIDTKRAKEAVPKISDALYRNIQTLARPHTDSGNMYRNITQKVSPSRMSAVVGIADRNMMVEWQNKRINYAFFVLLGTRPHFIHPKRKKALRFFNALGDFVFAKAVRHPGYRGDNFLHKAIQDTFKRIDRWI